MGKGCPKIHAPSLNIHISLCIHCVVTHLAWMERGTSLNYSDTNLSVIGDSINLLHGFRYIAAERIKPYIGSIYIKGVLINTKRRAMRNISGTRY